MTMISPRLFLGLLLLAGASSLRILPRMETSRTNGRGMSGRGMTRSTFFTTIPGALMFSSSIPVSAAPPNPGIEGEYSDPNHPKGFRRISIDGGIVKIDGNDSAPRGTEWSLVAKADGNSLFIDFSPKGGPKDLVGKFDGSGIVFPDGNRWPKK